MRKPVVLTGPGVTSEDVARIFKISRRRQNYLRKLIGLPPLPPAAKSGTEKVPLVKDGSGTKPARKRKSV
jgi:hypothetical protein